MYSNEYKKYLKKNKINNYLIKFTQISILVLLLLLWEYLARNNIINSFISSSPSRVIKAIINLYKQNNLFNNIWITVYETLISFILGTLIGTFIAIVLWYNKFIYKVVDPYLTILNSLPKVALGPIIIIYSGANINSIITMALLISVIITIITVYNGFVNTDYNKIKLLNSLKATKMQILKYVILPSSYSTIISSLKINVSMSLIGVIMGEFLVAREGLGFLIIYGGQIAQLDMVMMSIVILSVIAFLMFQFLFCTRDKTLACFSKWVSYIVQVCSG